MKGNGNGATERINRRKDFGDAYAEVRAWDVPASDRYPDGIKYSMQYGRKDSDTEFRYDNFPDHPDVGHHHKHTADGDVVGVDFDGLHALYERFKSEVRNYGHDWD